MIYFNIPIMSRIDSNLNKIDKETYTMAPTKKPTKIFNI